LVIVPKEKGLEEPVIGKDPVVKKLKATMRQAKRRLTQVAAMEQLKEQKLADKEKKAAAKKEARNEASMKAAKTPSGKESKKGAKPKAKKTEGGTK